MWKKVVGYTLLTLIATAPLAQHYLDYATLSAAVAKAFPQVKYFVVWNELKGFWNPTSQVTDVAGYTAMYNATYQAVKAVRPDALVGGPYVSVHSLAGPAPSTVPTPSGPWGHLGAEPLAFLPSPPREGSDLRPTQRMLESRPRSAVLARGDALGDEIHAVHAVGDVRIERVLPVEFLPPGPLDHVVVSRGVDVGESFEEGLGMACRDAR